MGGRTTPQRPLTPATRADLAGLYGPGSEGWRLNREAALLLGAGPRALLLQVGHPIVAEGVAQHSNFRADAWGRLAGTLRSYLRIVYGSGPAARAEIARLNRMHAAVTGPVRDSAVAARHGATYRALDPVIALWVHATLIDSTLCVVDAWQERLTSDVRARFYDETRPIGRLFGIPDALLPNDIDAFDGYMAAMLAPDGPIQPTAAARDITDAILRPPLSGVVRGPLADRLGPAAPLAVRLLDLVPQPAVDILMLPSIGLLPERLRVAYGLPWGARERVIDAWLVTSWRFWRPHMPPSLRWFPQALAADRR
ncbi:MAG: oxygenase MpaB family protein [Candidatus Limnocylindrales bacterium]